MTRFTVMGGEKAQNTAALSAVSGPEDNIIRKLVEPSESESLGCSHFQGWTLQRQTSILDVNCVFSWHLIIVRICEVQCDNSMCVHRPGVIVWWQRAYPACPQLWANFPHYPKWHVYPREDQIRALSIPTVVSIHPFIVGRAPMPSSYFVMGKWSKWLIHVPREKFLGIKIT